MPRKPLTKSKFIGFYCDIEMAELLHKMPDLQMSSFIRRALAAALGIDCPLCHGYGQVSRELHDHFAPMVSQMWQEKEPAHPACGRTDDAGSS